MFHPSFVCSTCVANVFFPHFLLFDGFIITVLQPSSLLPVTAALSLVVEQSKAAGSWLFQSIRSLRWRDTPGAKA